jgi:hypothetical protein
MNEHPTPSLYRSREPAPDGDAIAPKPAPGLS